MTDSRLSVTPDARTNHPPQGFRAGRDLPRGFLEFFRPLHVAFTPRRNALVAARRDALERSQRGALPTWPSPPTAARAPWTITLPEWCRDQRNQMTGPADDGELVVKMLNSGAPGVMLDLEDSMANTWEHLELGLANIHAALAGTLSYDDRKRGRRVGIAPSPTTLWMRVRGLHLGQAGVVDEVTSASLYDLARLLHPLDLGTLRHPPCLYIPKSESAEEAEWWRDVFQAIAAQRGWPAHTIRCMALVESHPLAFQMEDFLWNLRDHLVGLNLGRWDYMASLIHFTLTRHEWVLPDRNTIPHDVPFFQNLRFLMAGLCHARGMLAIGGMTALYPSREDADLNARALAVLEQDKHNEAACFMDGAWTGHPDQNTIAVAQFPAPNQVTRIPKDFDDRPDLRPVPEDVGRRTVDGTRAAVRTVIRYRNGVLNGRGASLLDGYMEDLATDRIYRLMLAQRLRHADTVVVHDGEGHPVRHTRAFVSALFDAELARLIDELPHGRDAGDARTLSEARQLSEDMIHRGQFDPV